MADISQSPDCYVVDKRISALHLDQALLSCTKHSNSEQDTIGCYNASTTRWNGQLQTMNGIILSRLSKRDKAQYQVENRQWDNRETRYFDSLSNALSGSKHAPLILAREHERVTRDRVFIQHREAVWKNIYQQ